MRLRKLLKKLRKQRKLLQIQRKQLLKLLLQPVLKGKGVKILSAVPDADTVYTDVDLTGPVAIVVGAEDKGLSNVWKTGADLNVKIPMLGKNDSLNVSVSAAILLYEAVRQRR